MDGCDVAVGIYLIFVEEDGLFEMLGVYFYIINVIVYK